MCLARLALLRRIAIAKIADWRRQGGFVLQLLTPHPISLDIAKSVSQVYGVNGGGQVVVRSQLKGNAGSLLVCARSTLSCPLASVHLGRLYPTDTYIQTWHCKCVHLSPPSQDQLAAKQDQLADRQEQMAQNIATLQEIEQGVRQKILSLPSPQAVRPAQTSVGACAACYRQPKQ
jgi:hypothetical protein